MDEAEQTNHSIRVLIVDDHQVVADGLALVLSNDPAVSVVGTAGTVGEATRLAADLDPDVILMDYYLPDGTAADAARAIRSQQSDVPLVMLTANLTDDALAEAVEVGACGFLSKSQAGTEVVDAVQRAFSKEMLIPAATLARLLSKQRGEKSEAPANANLAEPLTPREREVLSLMADGLDNHGIAQQLVVSYTTVRSHVENILEKLDAHSKLEAVAKAHQYGLLRR